MITLAVGLMLLPPLLLMVALARRERPLWQVALDVPTAVAADMLLLLLLSRLLTLEYAAFAAKGVEIVGAAAYVALRVRRGDRPTWPRALGAGPALCALASAAALTFVSLAISRPYQIWDRYWHISLVSTIRGQTLPFSNVYDPSGPLAYHYSGDALAAALQSLSGLTLHSSHALSLVHDVMFGLSGATLGLLLWSWGARGVSLGVVGALVWALAGPPALLRDDDKQWVGYNFVNYVTLSFRPHVSVAGLYLIGFVAALIGRVREAEVGEQRSAFAVTAAPLVVFVAALSVTDEASCAVLCAATGLAWSCWGPLLGPTRRHGVLLLVGFVLAILVANVAFAGLLAPGAERPGMSLVPWRSPGFAAPTLPFPAGAKFFYQDVAALVTLAVAFGLFALLARARAALALGVFGVVAVAIAVFALGRLHIPPKPVEAHRFVTAPMLAAPLIAMFLLARASSSRTSALLPFVAVLLGVGLVTPALSTFAWLRHPGKTPFQTQASFAKGEDFFRADCAKDLGVTYGTPPRPAYVHRAVFFSFVGCHPSFVAGRSGGHKIKTSAPLHGLEALGDLSLTALAPDAALDVVCPEGGGGDLVCARAMQAGACAPVGTTQGGVRVVRCVLDAASRAELVARLRAPSKGPPSAEDPRATDALDAESAAP